MSTRQRNLNILTAILLALMILLGWWLASDPALEGYEEAPELPLATPATPVYVVQTRAHIPPVTPMAFVPLPFKEPVYVADPRQIGAAYLTDRVVLRDWCHDIMRDWRCRPEFQPTHEYGH